MKGLFITLFLLFCVSAMGQDYDLGSGPIENESLNIEGDYAAPRRDQSDRLRKMRRRLEQKNEEMVARKIESIRAKKERELMKQLQRSFNQQLRAIDQIGEESSAAH